MNIAVIGTGYVGLVTGTCLAEAGNQVICVDINQEKINQMKQGIIPIYEPQLEDYFKRNILANRLSFTTKITEALSKSSILFLALPTPPGEDGSADLSYVLNVAETIGEHLQDYKIIINKSTVPVGTADKVREKILAHNPTADFDVVSNPEFLREGLAVQDFMNPDRIVIGTQSERALDELKKLYHSFIKTESQIVIMDERSAELTKYAANSFLAMKITFMNEIANICERTGANIDHIKAGIGQDPRIGSQFLNAGIGVGGSCFPKDMKALIQTAKAYNYDFKILNSVNEVNNQQKTALIPKLCTYLNHEIKGKKISLWGLAFKPDTDDIREAPALYIIEELLTLGAIITVYDPEAMSNVKKLLGDKIQYASSPEEALKEADALLICTEWNIFKQFDPNNFKNYMTQTLIFDGRNIFPLTIKNIVTHYESIGR